VLFKADVKPARAAGFSNLSASQSPSFGSAGAARSSDTLIFFPTYNEAETIGLMLDGLLALPVRCDLLIVDDNSADGTAGLIEERAKSDGRVRLIVRRGKLGIGSAHKLGWLHARRLGYSRFVSLDADLSHNPADVPRLLAALDAGADVAVGSRFAPGGRLDYEGWRLFLSSNANRFARLLLQLPLYEYTTSLRAAKLDRVPPGLVEGIAGQGYGFFLNCVVRFAREKLAITEVPIHFRNRHRGESKIPRLELLRGMANLLLLTVDRRRVKAAALPDSSCPACGGHYRVATRSGGVSCLECLAMDRTPHHDFELIGAPAAARDVAERPRP
jgi:dolichol-phosphate mannosyltransferase